VRKIRKFLGFLRLLDENAQLSITNIAVIIVMTKVAMTPLLNFAQVATLLGVISTYSFKRFVQRKAPKKEKVSIVEKLMEDLTLVKGDIDKIKIGIGVIPR